MWARADARDWRRRRALKEGEDKAMRGADVSEEKERERERERERDRERDRERERERARGGEGGREEGKDDEDDGKRTYSRGAESGTQWCHSRPAPNSLSTPLL